jgi:hypothetical protein
LKLHEIAMLRNPCLVRKIMDVMTQRSEVMGNGLKLLFRSIATCHHPLAMGYGWLKAA